MFKIDGFLKQGIEIQDNLQNNQGGDVGIFLMKTVDYDLKCTVWKSGGSKFHNFQLGIM